MLKWLSYVLLGRHPPATCDSCGKSYRQPQRWIEGRDAFLLCHSCLQLLSQQLQAEANSKASSPPLAVSNSENPYQASQVTNVLRECGLCRLHPPERYALLRNGTPICERCVTISLQMIDELEDETKTARL